MIGAVPARSDSDRTGSPHGFARRWRVARTPGTRPRCGTHATVRTRLRLKVPQRDGLPPAPGIADISPATHVPARTRRRSPFTPAAIRGPMPELPKIVQWCGSHFRNFDAAAHQDQKCAARRHVRVVRVAPLPADHHRWRGLRLAAPQHLSHPHPLPAPLRAATVSGTAPHRRPVAALLISCAMHCRAARVAARERAAQDPGRTPVARPRRGPGCPSRHPRRHRLRDRRPVRGRRDRSGDELGVRPDMAPPPQVCLEQ